TPRGNSKTCRTATEHFPRHARHRARKEPMNARRSTNDGSWRRACADRPLRHRFGRAALVALLVMFLPQAGMADDLESRASWTPPSAADVKERVEVWLADENVK